MIQRESHLECPSFFVMTRDDVAFAAVIAALLLSLLWVRARVLKLCKLRHTSVARARDPTYSCEGVASFPIVWRFFLYVVVPHLPCCWGRPEPLLEIFRFAPRSLGRCCPAAIFSQRKMLLTVSHPVVMVCS